MNLYFLPDAANDSSGHCIEISRSLARLKPDETNSVKVWYAKKNSGKYMLKGDIYIPVQKKISIHSFYNMFRGKIHTTLSHKQLDFLRQYKLESLETVHLEDPMFYEAFRYYYPKKQINVHFHNVFLRIKTRCQILNIKVDCQYLFFLTLFSSLEKRIFRDERVKKIFICKEDADFYHEMTRNNDYEVWPVTVDCELMKKNQQAFDWGKRFVWFGGVKAHKRLSVLSFINNVFFPLKKHYPQIEFHLWGNGTKSFDNKAAKIYGHGYFDGKDFPYKNESLYINPDLTGGGVKLKVKTYLEKGIPFISTPFGFEGYEESLIDGKYCHVVSFDQWNEYILNMFK